MFVKENPDRKKKKKSDVWKQNRGWLFYYFILKEISPSFLLSKNTKFSKNKTESKMEIPSFVLQLVHELRNESKTVMSWCSRKKKSIFVTFILSEGNFFNIWV